MILIENNDFKKSDLYLFSDREIKTVLKDKITDSINFLRISKDERNHIFCAGLILAIFFLKNRDEAIRIKKELGCGQIFPKVRIKEIIRN